MKQSQRLWLVVLFALLLVVGGSLIASWVQTNGNTVTIKDVRFVGANGTVMSALLYVPQNATAKTPAPGVVAIHGYINSRETQSGYAIEFARRGYVVLAPDQTGHGYSQPPAMANGFGGPDSLRYLRTLDIVDKNNIGLEGHSMGGWASVIAAQTYPNDYTAMMLQGSSTGTYGGITGTTTFPKNLGLVFSKYDEFSALMWLSPVPADMVKNPKTLTLFGATGAVEIGKLYGDVAAGTARKLYMPAITHPSDHISTEAIGAAIEWFQLTLKGGTPLPASDQIWYWKEIATFVALIGLVIFFMGVGGLLLETAYFSPLKGPLPEFKGLSGRGWWIAAVLTAGLAPLLYFWGNKTAGDWIKAPTQASPNVLWPKLGNVPIWPQNLTTGLMGWVVIIGAISLVLFLLWHFLSNRKLGATGVNYGLKWEGKGYDWGKIWKSFVLAATVALLGYLLLAIADWWLKVDFRFWVLALKTMSPVHFRSFLFYLIPFMFFFVILSTTLHSQLRVGSYWREVLVNCIILTIGFVILLLVQYIPLLLGKTLMWPAENLRAIIAIQIIPLMVIVSCISTYFYHKTGHIWVGAFLNSIFITWYIVAGQATHYAV